MIDPPRPRVLIADDDPAIRRMLAVTLGKQGYDTADACDGQEALDAMQAGHVDLVLLDLMMPKMTGWQVLTEREATPALRKIPVIVITAGRGDTVEQIDKGGVCELLLKPFDFEVLQAMVKSCLAHD